ncbi:MAG: hypothetical protein ACOYOK_11920 [Pseudobdellovibrionaceae bacterium]
MQLKPLQLQYNLSNKNQLQLGPFELSEKTFRVSLESKDSDYILHIQWPQSFIEPQRFWIQSSVGKELWTQKRSVKDTAASDFSLSTDDLKIMSGQFLQLCLHSEKEKQFATLCTGPFAVVLKNQKISLKPLSAFTDAQILVQKASQPFVGSIEFGKEILFWSRLQSGIIYTFYTEPKNIKPLNALLDDQDHLWLTGRNEFPLSPAPQTHLLNPDSFWLEALRFQRTIAGPENLWSISLEQNEVGYWVQGQQGGIFFQSIERKHIPKISDWPRLGKRALKSSYREKIPVRLENGYALPSTIGEKGSEHFANFKLASSPWTFSVPVYRGYSNEASLRLTAAVSSTGSAVLLSEGHISMWFERVLNWTNYYWSEQRWGISAKYFSNINSLPAQTSATTTENIALKSINVDLKYRFEPGLWTRDETIGAILSIEDYTFGPYHFTKVGPGVFWARSMPKIFDEWLNKFSFFQKPKWVDAEFVYFTQSLSSEYILRPNYTLNFHGKILWTPRFYGEAGFSLRNNAFYSKAKNLDIAFAAFFGTVGVGIQF